MYLMLATRLIASRWKRESFEGTSRCPRLEYRGQPCAKVQGGIEVWRYRVVKCSAAHA